MATMTECRPRVRRLPRGFVLRNGKHSADEAAMSSGVLLSRSHQAREPVSLSERNVQRLVWPKESRRLPNLPSGVLLRARDRAAGVLSPRILLPRSNGQRRSVPVSRGHLQWIPDRSNGCVTVPAVRNRELLPRSQQQSDEMSCGNVQPDCRLCGGARVPKLSSWVVVSPRRSDQFRGPLCTGSLLPKQHSTRGCEAMSGWNVH